MLAVSFSCAKLPMTSEEVVDTAIMTTRSSQLSVKAVEKGRLTCDWVIEGLVLKDRSASKQDIAEICKPWSEIIHGSYQKMISIISILWNGCTHSQDMSC